MTQQQKRERSQAVESGVIDTDEEAVLGDETTHGELLADAVLEGADSLSMVEFTEPSASMAHGHSPAKGEGTHDLRGAFGVSEEFIRAHFSDGVVPNGHEALHALLAGRQRFIDADEPIFEDVPDTSATRWQAIRATAAKAPIPPGRRADLDAAFGY